MRTIQHRITVFALFCMASLTATSASTRSAVIEVKPSPAYPESVPKPTLSNIPYGTHKKQVLDFWKAPSASPDNPSPLLFVIHGGGWKSGSKERTIKGLLDINGLLRSGISALAINYRLVTDAMVEGIVPPVKASLDDAARALQFVRSKAGEWHIDKNRIALTGGSAGGCTALWLAYHDDMADPNSNDPVARESTCVVCAAVYVAQTSLDPRQMVEWVPNSHYGGHAFGEPTFKDFLAKREELLPWIRKYSPYANANKGDPPVFLMYNSSPAVGKEQKDPTHTANFGVTLQEHCSKQGVECELYYSDDLDEKTRQDKLTNYLISRLKTAF
jgi:acetyl esterase/lipase